MCGHIDVCPSNNTEKAWISASRAAIEAPIWRYHPPLPPSKTVLSSSSLIVICLLIAPGVTGITCWNENRQRGTRGTSIVSTGYQGTTCVCYVLVSRMYEFSRMNMNISMSLFLLDTRYNIFDTWYLVGSKAQKKTRKWYSQIRFTCGI